MGTPIKENTDNNKDTKEVRHHLSDEEHGTEHPDNPNPDNTINTSTSSENADIGNPFIIKKRINVPVPPLRSICIFKKQMPLYFFYEFIQQLCGPPIESAKIMHILKSGCRNATDQPEEELSLQSLFYMVDIFAFKRGIYMNIIRPFMDIVATQYYRPAHAFYAQRTMTGVSAFTHFIQVIRHISKHVGLKIISTVKYEQSISSKVYYVEYRHTPS